MYGFGSVGGDADLLKVGHAFEQIASVRSRLKMYALPSSDIPDSTK